MFAGDWEAPIGFAPLSELSPEDKVSLGKQLCDCVRIMDGGLTLEFPSEPPAPVADEAEVAAEPPAPVAVEAEVAADAYIEVSVVSEPVRQLNLNVVV